MKHLIQPDDPTQPQAELIGSAEGLWINVRHSNGTLIARLLLSQPEGGQPQLEHWPVNEVNDPYILRLTENYQPIYSEQSGLPVGYAEDASEAIDVIQDITLKRSENHTEIQTYTNSKVVLKSEHDTYHWKAAATSV